MRSWWVGGEIWKGTGGTLIARKFFLPVYAIYRVLTIFFKITDICLDSHQAIWDISGFKYEFQKEMLMSQSEWFARWRNTGYAEKKEERPEGRHSTGTHGRVSEGRRRGSSEGRRQGSTEPSAVRETAVMTWCASSSDPNTAESPGRCLNGLAD